MRLLLGILYLIGWTVQILSFPSCSTGEPPLMEANDAFHCDRGCPVGFDCEYQDVPRTPSAGICCANKTLLIQLYGTENDKHVDPIWNKSEIESTRTASDLPASSGVSNDATTAPESLNVTEYTSPALRVIEPQLEDVNSAEEQVTVGPTEEVTVESASGLKESEMKQITVENINEIEAEMGESEATEKPLEYTPAVESVIHEAKHEGNTTVEPSEVTTTTQGSSKIIGEIVETPEEEVGSAEEAKEATVVAQLEVKESEEATSASSVIIAANETSGATNDSQILEATVIPTEHQVTVTVEDPVSEKKQEEILNHPQVDEGRQQEYSCDRQKYSVFCHDGSVMTQPVLRWYLNKETKECEFYPWGYCPGDRIVVATSLRTKEDCEFRCTVTKTSGNIADDATVVDANLAISDPKAEQKSEFIQKEKPVEPIDAKSTNVADTSEATEKPELAISDQKTEIKSEFLEASSIPPALPVDSTSSYIIEVTDVNSDLTPEEEIRNTTVIIEETPSTASPTVVEEVLTEGSGELIITTENNIEKLEGGEKQEKKEEENNNTVKEEEKEDHNEVANELEILEETKAQEIELEDKSGEEKEEKKEEKINETKKDEKDDKSKESEEDSASDEKKEEEARTEAHDESSVLQVVPRGREVKTKEIEVIEELTETADEGVKETTDGISYQQSENALYSLQCTRTSYRHLCPTGMPAQFVYRWEVLDGKCQSFPYGYCYNGPNHGHPRTQQECEQYCLKGGEFYEKFNTLSSRV